MHKNNRLHHFISYREHTHSHSYTHVRTNFSFDEHFCAQNTVYTHTAIWRAYMGSIKVAKNTMETQTTRKIVRNTKRF